MFLRLARRRQTHQQSQHRPRSVSFAGWLIILQGSGFLGAGAMRILVSQRGDLGYDFLAPLTSHGTVYLLLSGGVWILLGLLALISALALWKMHKFAWTAAMLLQMMALSYSLVTYLRGSSNYLAMAFGVIIVFILNNREVQDAFRQ